MLYAVEPLVAAEIEYRRERAHADWGTRRVRRPRLAPRTSRARPRVR